MHDGSDEVLTQFPYSTSGAMKSSTQRAAQDAPGSVCYRTLSGAVSSVDVPASSGSAARFYCAKASKSDRGADNIHPTVKPTDLMAYLCRLVTPPGGVVLDPFMGSGSTGKAAMREGFRFIGCDLSPEYLAIARARIEHELAAKVANDNLPHTGNLFSSN
jgi:site-specific DNA-methyltransferase (adenine-specific)